MKALILKSLFVVSSLCHIVILEAQALSSLTGAGNQHDTEAWLSRNQLRLFNEPDGFVGDIYFGGDWLSGSITTRDGLKLENTMIRYNLFTNQIVAQLNRVSFVLKPNSVVAFTLIHESNALLFKSDSIDGFPNYLQLLYDGQTKLFSKHSVKKIEKDAGTQAYGSGVAYDKYVKSQEYYAKVDNELISLKPTRKSIYEVFSSRQNELKAMMKETKPQLKTDQGLIAVFEYYDQLKK